MVTLDNIINPDAYKFGPLASPTINVADSLNKQGGFMAFGPARVVSVLSAAAFWGDQALNCVFFVAKAVVAVALKIMELCYGAATGHHIDLGEKFGLSNYTAEQAGKHALNAVLDFVGVFAAVLSFVNPSIIIEASRALGIAHAPEAKPVETGLITKTINAGRDALSMVYNTVRHPIANPKKALALATVVGAAVYTGRPQAIISAGVSAIMNYFAEKKLGYDPETQCSVFGPRTDIGPRTEEEVGECPRFAYSMVDGKLINRESAQV